VRSQKEIQYSHDLLKRALEDPDIRARVFGVYDDFIMRAGWMKHVLCWVLGHDSMFPGVMEHVESKLGEPAIALALEAEKIDAR
jgi:hypothetical protein